MTTHYEAHGQWIESAPYSTEGWWSICTSEILTQLIQSCGRYCKKYASDLFNDWAKIVNELEKGEPIDKKYIFAIRDYGIDNASQVKIRQENPDVYEQLGYHEVWELTVKSVDNDRWLEMELNLIAN